MRAARKTETGLRLRLYIAGNAANSLRAIANAKAICAEHYPLCLDLEIVDLLEQPRRAQEDGVIVTPTLLRMTPLPIQRVIGDLRDTSRVLTTLGEQ